MAFRVCVLLSIVFVVAGITQSTVAFPRDSTVVKTDELPVNHDESILKSNFDQETASEPKTSGRLYCQHGGSEPIEDEVCQGHCIPKGYSYGLCVSNTCSCI